MSFSLTAFLIALLGSLALTPVVRFLMNRWGVVDHPREYRKIHSRSIPRMGGLAIFSAFWISILAILFLYENASEVMQEGNIQILGMLLGSLAILGVGIYDDLKGASPFVKVAFQTFATVVVFYFGFKIPAINTPFGIIEFGYFTFPATWLWVVGATNAINLIDGMDGLATGVSLVAGITMFILAFMSGSWLAAIPLAAFAGATAGFLLYNFHPASIFLGDTGSLMLGFLLSCMALLSSYRHAAVGLAIPLIIFALPISDTMLAVLRRWSKRMPISTADRDHIHHRLLAFGFSQTQAVGILYLLAIFSGVIAIILSMCNSSMQLIVGSLLGIALIIALKFMKWADIRLVSDRIQRDVKRTRQKSDNWELINKTCNEIRYVRSEHLLKKMLIKVFEGLDLDRVVLVTSVPSILRPGKTFAFKWYKENKEYVKPYSNAWSAHLTIKKNETILGRIHVIQNADRSELPADISACLKTICEALSHRLLPHKAIIPVHQIPDGIKDNNKCGKDHRPKILIVGAEKKICDFITESLSRNGWSLDAFTNHDDAIGSIQRNFYHLAFVDLMMPKIKGKEMVKELLIENPTLRIVAISDGENKPDSMEEVLNLGAVTFITKPFDQNMIRNIVEKTI